ncbi:co-chaperone GrpE [Fonticula alba]|uniref:GrpE protein homolog n=1 Tax=Fonticula alba TaxID=691883 RepID=A0A058Z9F3_FONAL|nr:co-chaperone GrpE [Fonticula alba]KCV70939.1 co-chaperone GrpE [Fonticula alba]|eukprot:XP_009494062.1 co-chaperone GrpE [Fonticula alba]
MLAIVSRATAGHAARRAAAIAPAARRTFFSTSSANTSGEKPADEAAAAGGAAAAAAAAEPGAEGAAAEGAVADHPSVAVISGLETRVNELQTQNKELEDKFLRALAETEHVRQLGRREVDKQKLFAIQGFSKDLLETVDVLELALASVPEAERTSDDNPHLKNLYEGLSMADKELRKVFAKYGLVQHDPMGQPFDANIHDALFEMDHPEWAPGTVAYVQRKGFTLHDRPIRPAQVGVVRRAPE